MMLWRLRGIGYTTFYFLCVTKGSQNLFEIAISFYEIFYYQLERYFIKGYCQPVGCWLDLRYKDQNSPFDNSFSNKFSLFQLDKNVMYKQIFAIYIQKIFSENNLIKTRQFWTILLCYELRSTEKRTYINKGCNLLNPFLLTFLLPVPLNKLPCLLVLNRTKARRNKIVKTLWVNKFRCEFKKTFGAKTTVASYAYFARLVVRDDQCWHLESNLTTRLACLSARKCQENNSNPLFLQLTIMSQIVSD